VTDSTGAVVLQDVVVSAGLESSYRVGEARGLALSHDEGRLYLLGRAPDTLIVVNVNDPTGDMPTLDVVRAVPLPEGANEIRTIPRSGRSDLVVVTCTGQGVLVVYDDDVGDLVAQVQGVGLQSFGLAYALRPPGARLFVTNFSDGRVALIDIPDLDRPQEARIAGYLGAQQLCLTRGSATPGCTSREVSQ
jgi:DNA-binding beta-propeller fold protein YncE